MKKLVYDINSNSCLGADPDECYGVAETVQEAIELFKKQQNPETIKNTIIAVQEVNGHMGIVLYDRKTGNQI